MEKAFEERVKNLETITDRHVAREIEGCTSWRHFVVHQDRGWLLTAFSKVQNQIENIRLAASGSGEEHAVETEVRALLDMFEQETLNHLGDEDK